MKRALWKTVAMGVTLAAVPRDGLRAADYWWNGSTASFTSQNWESPSGTPTTAVPGNWDAILNTQGGKVTLDVMKQPGYFRFATGEFEIVAGGTLQALGSGGAAIANGPATVTVNGGAWKGFGPSVGITAGGGTMNLRAGTLGFSQANSGNTIFFSGSDVPAVVRHTGGTVDPTYSGTPYNIVIAKQETWAHENADYFLGDADASDGVFSGAGGLIVGHIASKMSGSGYQRTTYGRLIGWGTVGLTGTLRNNGYVIADGYGTARTLDLSSFGAIANTVGNDQYKLSGDNAFYYGKGGTGWFAVNQGRLLLPAVAVAVGSAAYNWGEASDDTDIDLANAVRLDFTDVTNAGNASIALLATDRPEVDDTTGTLLAVWEVGRGSAAFASVTPTVRYDAVGAVALSLVEADLKLYARAAAGAPWTDITASVDTTKKQLSGVSVTELGQLAVGVGVALEPPGGTRIVVK